MTTLSPYVSLVNGRFLQCLDNIIVLIVLSQLLGWVRWCIECILGLECNHPCGIDVIAQCWKAYINTASKVYFLWTLSLVEHTHWSHETMLLCGQACSYGYASVTDTGASIAASWTNFIFDAASFREFPAINIPHILSADLCQSGNVFLILSLCLMLSLN